MREISPKELNSEFDATLSTFSSANLNEPDDELGRLVFEEFDIGITSFLHETSLKRLLCAGYIDNDIKELCAEFRMKAVLALRNYRSVAAVRDSESWKEVIELCDKIKLLKTAHDQARST